MVEYVGLDVSLKETSVCVLDGSGQVLWRGVCQSTPEAMAATLRKRAPAAERVVLESGTLSTWHWHGLKGGGIPVVCVDARQAKAAVSGRPNKSDELDAEGLAQLARTGWYAEVRVKSYDSHRVRSVLVARAKLVGMKRTLSNTIPSDDMTRSLSCGPRRAPARTRPGRGGALNAFVCAPKARVAATPPPENGSGQRAAGITRRREPDAAPSPA